jgi:hypothetical protein
MQQVKSSTSNLFVPQNVANIQKNPFVQIRKGSFFLSSQCKNSPNKKHWLQWWVSGFFEKSYKSTSFVHGVILHTNKNM